MVIVVTGAIGIGKTTVCQKVIEIACSQGYSCGGVVTRKSQNADILIEDVQTGETRVLASTSTTYRGPRTAKYSFNPEGISFGIEAIEKGIASDILLVDELGHLELRGEGFADIVDQITTRKVESCILVIRKELLSSFLVRLGVATLVFETALDNRNQLPREILLALGCAAAG